MEINKDNYEAFLLDYFEGNLGAEQVEELKAFALLHPELEIVLDGEPLPVLNAETAIFQNKEDLKQELNSDTHLLISYLEGLLSPAEKTEIEKRLQNDQMLAQELSLLKLTVLGPEPGIIFENKETLHSYADQHLLANQSLRYVENDLPIAERAQFEKELAVNAGLKKEVSQFQQTLLRPDLSIVFPGRRKLKKGGRVIVMFAQWQAVAAALLIVSGIIFFYRYDNSTDVAVSQVADRTKAPEVAVIIPENRPANGDPAIPAGQPHISETIAPAITPVKRSERSKDVVAPELSNPVAVTVDKDSVSPILNHELQVDEKLALAPDTGKKEVAVPVEKQTLLAYSEDEGEDAEEAGNKRKGLWQKAVAVAQQANRLGLKSVDGESDGKQRFRLSFNSFTVEKY